MFLVVVLSSPQVVMTTPLWHLAFKKRCQENTVDLVSLHIILAKCSSCTYAGHDGHAFLELRWRSEIIEMMCAVRNSRLDRASCSSAVLISQPMLKLYTVFT